MRLIKDRVQMCEAPIERLELLYYEDKMDLGHFYFLSDQYYIDFPDPQLMQNHEAVGGISHDRPCFFAFKDCSTELYWMIPASSQVEKYQRYYETKIKKYGKCDTIAFGEVLGRKKAFLIQNMCPITPEYIKNEYIANNTLTPVRVNGVFEAELLSKAKKVLALQRKGFNLIFPDVLKIEKELLSKP